MSVKGGARFALRWHLMGGAVAHVWGVVLTEQVGRIVRQLDIHQVSLSSATKYGQV